MEETLEAPRAKASRDLQPGATLGKYRLERILGSGGMGVVWAAHDPDLDRAVALKVLRYDSPSTELRTRLLREARAMAKLKHPNVLTVYDVDTESDRDFIAMELVDGASLDAWLETKPPRAEVWDAIVAAGRGLAAAHRAGLVHRDFKPHNVLRSSDGRVMVTDFGLARGDDGRETIALERTLSARPASGLEQTIEHTPATALDSKLTQTGALIGTPAYMAPEQFAGASSGPRTDQFAFCVTAWQLLTGERPFRGDTLEELRDATRAGQVRGKLPGAIHAVLARGLAADPAKRWPDMETLLAALERAKRRPVRVAQIAGMIAIAGLAVALAVKVLGAPPSKDSSSSVCPLSAEEEIAKAWSPESAKATRARIKDRDAADYVVGEMDFTAARWVASYKAACEAPRTSSTLPKLGCLLGQRDYIAGIAQVFPRIPEEVWQDAEFGGIFPRAEACEVDSPVPPPAMPSDPQRRARIVELRPRILLARFEEPEKAIGELDKMLDEAKALGWEPLIAEAHHSLGMMNRRIGRHFEGRAHYERANELARRSHQYLLEADTWDGLLDAELDAAPDPRDEGRFERLVEQAWAAVRNAGDDPVSASHITQSEASYLLSRDRFDEAIEKLDTARKQAFAARDGAHGTRVALDEAIAILRRNRPDDLERAWAMVGDTERLADAAKLRQNKRPALAAAFWIVALMRGEPQSAYTRIDRFARLYPVRDAVDLEGQVVDADGKPVAGATVVTWVGALAGDATRVYTKQEFSGAIATTDAAGHFAIKGSRAGGIIAEHGDQRSQPRAIGAAPLVLALAPTRTIAGTVESDDEALAGVVASAHYELGPRLAWSMLAPVGRARAFRFTNLPAGDATLRFDDVLDPNRPLRKVDVGPLRDGMTARWDKGVSLDAIVLHGNPAHRFWLFRGKQTAKTQADLEAIYGKLSLAMTHEALEIGIGDETKAGMPSYQPGARHARFFHTPAGELTICVSEPIACKQVTVGNQDVAVVF